LAVLLLCCLGAQYIYGTVTDKFFSLIWGITGLGVVIGMILTRQRRLEAWTGAWTLSEFFCLADAGIGLAVFSYWCGMRQFGGFDQSGLIDAGWRILCGQKVYQDFPCTLPVASYAGAALAFSWFGVFWSSFVKISVLYFLITYVWFYVILRQVLQNRLLAFALVVTAQCMTLILGSYWWYNPTTSVAIILYTSSVAAVLLRPKSAFLWLSLTLSLCLACLMKPNSAGMAVLGGSIALLVHPATSAT